jgi:hypothetical protein
MWMIWQWIIAKRPCGIQVSDAPAEAGKFGLFRKPIEDAHDDCAGYVPASCRIHGRLFSFRQIYEIDFHQTAWNRRVAAYRQ